MKIYILIVALLISFHLEAQSINPLYLLFPSEEVNNGLWKYENSWRNIQNEALKEDSYHFNGSFVGGFPLRMTTYNKRDFTIINQNDLVNYNVKTIEEIRVMMASKTEAEQLNFWGPLHEQKKLYIIELLPDGKAKIVKVWIEPH